MMIFHTKRMLLIILIILSGCDKAPVTEVELPTRSFENKVGTVFTPIPENLFLAPLITEIKFNVPESIDAIWGATGRDDDGKIYFGASSHGGDYGSAFLYQYTPDTGDIIEQSDVVSELKRNNVYREGMRQNKLHSKFYQADDGYLYFSSFDEGGEAEGINPTWGGNLWRKQPNEKHWQHILATEEALVAINTNGRFVYALGYWGHVLYQYDTKTDKASKVTVGSTQMHVSRNFIVDELGHAYVPKLTEDDFNEVEVMLAEYDSELKLIATYPMPSYQSSNFKRHHGIVGYTSMENGDIYFTSADGGLYQVRPFVNSVNKVTYKGMMHPDGNAYIASLFTFEGDDFVAGVGRARGSDKFEWIIYNLDAGLSVNYPLNTKEYKGLLLYGSSVKNEQGSFFVGGWARKKIGKGYRPVLQKISYTINSPNGHNIK